MSLSLISRLKEQHLELQKLTQSLVEYLEGANLSSDAGETRVLLERLAGKLDIHLITEDTSLYPMLLKNKDEEIREIAVQLQRELGGVKEQFYAYIQRWPTASPIQKNPTQFIRETREILRALNNRMLREENELFKKFI